jgi:hypothetical protein
MYVLRSITGPIVVLICLQLNSRVMIDRCTPSVEIGNELLLIEFFRSQLQAA